MAGAGYKNFNAGDVLTSADVDTYLMEQSIMVFAGTAARASAISSPSEGMFTYLSDTNTLQYYTGTAWVDSYSATNGAAVTNRNLLYNGAMQVAQRGTSVASITTAGYKTADRWNIFGTGGNTIGTWTQSVENDAPAGSGFRKSLKMLCTTAKASLAASDSMIFYQSLEGQDLQRIAKGTASAQQLTLSFWVKSNVTGTFIAELNDTDNLRAVSAAYTISASATWEKKSITFPADTTGVFNDDNAGSLNVTWWLVAGSNFTSGTLASSWASTTAANEAPGQVNVAAATNNYWQVTGVQLEVGPVATSFEFKSYGQELRECQRYYWRQNADATALYARFSGYGLAETTTVANIPIPLTTQMRSTPTSIDSSNVAVVDGTSVIATTALALVSNSNTRNVPVVSATVASGLTVNRAYALIANNNSGAFFGLSAEL